MRVHYWLHWGVIILCFGIELLALVVCWVIHCVVSVNSVWDFIFMCDFALLILCCVVFHVLYWCYYFMLDIF